MAAVPSLSEPQRSGDSHPAVSHLVQKLVEEVLAGQRRNGVQKIPSKYSGDCEERKLALRFEKLLLRRDKALGTEPSRSQLSPSEVALVNSVPGVPLHPREAPSDRSDIEANVAAIEKENVNIIMQLHMKQLQHEAFKAGRKLWESRALFARMKDGSLEAWYLGHLATKGRKVKLQSGPWQASDMRVAEVRRFEPDASTSTSAVRAMVEELGADLLPDEPNTDARIETYLRMYDAEVCARGFVAMRLERVDKPAAMPQQRSESEGHAAKATRKRKRKRRPCPHCEG